MKSVLMIVALMTCGLTMTAPEAEAGPIRKAIQWKANHRPVRNFFANRRPVRKAVRFVGRGVGKAARVTARGVARGACCVGGGCPCR